MFQQCWHNANVPVHVASRSHQPWVDKAGQLEQQIQKLQRLLQMADSKTWAAWQGERQQRERAAKAGKQVAQLEQQIKALQELRNHDQLCKQAARRGEQRQRTRANKAEALVRKLSQQVKDLRQQVQNRDQQNKAAACHQSTQAKQAPVKAEPFHSGPIEKSEERRPVNTGPAEDARSLQSEEEKSLGEASSSDIATPPESEVTASDAERTTASPKSDTQASACSAESGDASDTSAALGVPIQGTGRQTVPWTRSFRAYLTGLLCSQVESMEAPVPETPSRKAPFLKALQPASSGATDHADGRRSESDATGSISFSSVSKFTASGSSRFKALTPDVPNPSRNWRVGIYWPKEQDRLFFAEARLRKLGKALHPLLLDPLTDELMKEPVMAPEGTTYDATSIMKWIAHSPTDPRTRQPLTAGMLRRNRQADALLSIFRATFPDLQEIAGDSEKPSRTKAIDQAKELFEAILAFEETKALEKLAGRELDDEILNGIFEDEGLRGSLLVWAIGCDLPTVAVALIRRNDYRMLLVPPESHLSPLQLAAALGQRDTCEELLKRLPLPLAFSPTCEEVMFNLEDGGQTLIEADSTALTIARQLGHTEICELFEAAIQGPQVILRATPRIRVLTH